MEGNLGFGDNKSKTNDRISLINEYCRVMNAKKPIYSLLIANNGIAAVKFIRSIRSWAYETFGEERAILLIAMASPEDMKVNAEHIYLADQFVEVSGGANNNNYANVQLIVEVAERTGVDAVWPGWGHASENPQLPESLESKGILFLGPPAYAMSALGDKIGSSLVAQAANVPTLPWSGSNVELPPGTRGDSIPPLIYSKSCCHNADEAIARCQSIGYPAMIKASWGGGGKGIRQVHNEEEVKTMFRQVQGEVPGSPIFIMKVAHQSRHLEVQLACDQYGHVAALHSRDCSIQRRHQKIIEEGPITVADEDIIVNLEKGAVRLAKFVNYVGLATAEFLYSVETNSFYFLELNPRLQVEHPVTEWISGINLPSIQLAIAMGIPLWKLPEIRRFYGQIGGGDLSMWRISGNEHISPAFDFEKVKSWKPKGHVVAVRVTSEDPDDGFKPTCGKVWELSFRSKPDVWAYFSIKSGGGIHEFSDSQFGHLFAFGENRKSAISNMVITLKEIRIRGEIRTNIDYIVNLIQTKEFETNNFHTGWLDTKIAMKLKIEKKNWFFSVICGSLYLASRLVSSTVSEYISYLEKGQIPPKNISLVNFDVSLCIEGIKYMVKLIRRDSRKYILNLNNSFVEAKVHTLQDGGLLIQVDGNSHVIYGEEEPSGTRLMIGNHTCLLQNDHDPSRLIAESPCKLLRYLIPDNCHVSNDTPYAEVEIMKMCMPLLTPASGIIHFQLSEGKTMDAGDLIAILDLDDRTAVKKMTYPFLDKFPYLKNPIPVGEKTHQQFTHALDNANMILDGYDHDVDDVVSQLLNCLDDPRLPFFQWKEIYSVFSNRLPNELKLKLESVFQNYEKNEFIHVNQNTSFPSKLLLNTIEDYISTLSNEHERNVHTNNFSPLLNLITSYENGIKGNAIKILISFFEKYYDIEELFSKNSEADVIENLRKIHKKNLTKVLDIVLSHQGLKRKNNLILKFFEILVLPNPLPYQKILTKISTLNHKKHLEVALKASQLLEKTKFFELRADVARSLSDLHMFADVDTKNVQLSPAAEETDAHYENYFDNKIEYLVHHPHAIEHILIGYFLHSDKNLRRRSLITYIRRLYEPYLVKDSINILSNENESMIATWQFWEENPPPSIRSDDEFLSFSEESSKTLERWGTMIISSFSTPSSPTSPSPSPSSPFLKVKGIVNSAFSHNYYVWNMGKGKQKDDGLKDDETTIEDKINYGDDEEMEEEKEKKKKEINGGVEEKMGNIGKYKNNENNIQKLKDGDDNDRDDKVKDNIDDSKSKSKKIFRIQTCSGMPSGMGNLLHVILLQNYGADVANRNDLMESNAVKKNEINTNNKKKETYMDELLTDLKINFFDTQISNLLHKQGFKNVNFLFQNSQTIEKMQHNFHYNEDEEGEERKKKFDENILLRHLELPLSDLLELEKLHGFENIVYSNSKDKKWHIYSTIEEKNKIKKSFFRSIIRNPVTFPTISPQNDKINHSDTATSAASTPSNAPIINSCIDNFKIEKKWREELDLVMKDIEKSTVKDNVTRVKSPVDLVIDVLCNAIESLLEEIELKIEKFDYIHVFVSLLGSIKFYDDDGDDDDDKNQRNLNLKSREEKNKKYFEDLVFNNLEKIMNKIDNIYGQKMHNSKIFHFEIRIRIKDLNYANGPWRAIIYKIVPFTSNIEIYREVDLSGKKFYFCPKKEKKFKFHFCPINEKYKEINSIDYRRLIAIKNKTTFCYDFPLIFNTALNLAWEDAKRQNKDLTIPDNIDFHVSELVLSPPSDPTKDETLTQSDRPIGSNDRAMVSFLIHMSTPECRKGRKIIIIANDVSVGAGSFTPLEDKLFRLVTEFAISEKLPLIYLAANSGARIGLAEEIKSKFKIKWMDEIDSDKGFEYLYLTQEDYDLVKEYVVGSKITEPNGEVRWMLTDIIGKEDGLGVENLSGSGEIAGCFSKAYKETFTLTYVTGRTVGIGAYLARLGVRIIQRTDQPIILTGFSALNKLLGREVYSSHMQLGGPKIMAFNGVVHATVDDDLAGVRQILHWLSYIPAVLGQRASRLVTSDPVHRQVDYVPEPTCNPLAAIQGLTQGNTWQGGIFDCGSFTETLADWARTVVIGRARLGGIPVGVISVQTSTVVRTIPADPGQPDSHERFVTQPGQVWFPDSATKTACALSDFDREGLPLFILANWRGFAGGQGDLFEGILQAGSSIVENLRTYRHPVFVYIPRGGELRGGAWVVVDSKINPGMVEMYADVAAKGSVLEPEGMVEIKFREKEMIKCMHRIDSSLIELNMRLRGLREMQEREGRGKQGVENGLMKEDWGRGEDGGKEEKRSHGNEQGRELLTQSNILKEMENVKMKIKERERILFPLYKQIAIRFAELHDTSKRMLEKGVIKKIVPWETSRKFFYHRLLQRLGEEDMVKQMTIACNHSLSCMRLKSLLREWLEERRKGIEWIKGEEEGEGENGDLEGCVMNLATIWALESRNLDNEVEYKEREREREGKKWMDWFEMKLEGLRRERISKEIQNLISLQDGVQGLQLGLTSILTSVSPKAKSEIMQCLKGIMESSLCD